MHAAKCLAPSTRAWVAPRPPQRSRVSLRRSQQTRAVPADLLSTFVNSIPQEALLAGGAAAILGLGAIAFGLQQASKTLDEASPAAFAEQELPRDNAVLVVGATGRTGIELVQKVGASSRGG